MHPPAEAKAVGLAIAQRVSEAAPLALQAALAHAGAWADVSDAAGFARSIPDIIRLLNSEDSAEAFRALMANRTPEFSGR